MEKAETNGSYSIGVVGAILGGLIGTLPWILCYVYANMMYSILSVFIPICAFKGFELFKGRVDKKLPIIIGIISFAAITLATLVIIPHLLLIKEYGQTSMELFNALYKFSEFKSGIMHDYIFSLLFTALGAGSIIMNIKRSIDSGDEKVTFTNPLVAPSNEEIDAVKEVFKKKQAMSKEHAIDKVQIMDEIKENDRTFNFLLARGIIVRKKGQYYYSEENEQHPNKRALKIFAITFGVTILVIALIAVLVAILV